MSFFLPPTAFDNISHANASIIFKQTKKTTEAPMTLYADMLFLVNFMMNALVLWVVSKATRKRHNRKFFYLSIACGAALMALLYTLHLAIPAARGINVLLSSVLILTAGICVTFRVNKFRTFAKLMAISYILAFTVGGLGMSLFFLTDVPYIYFLVGDFQGFARQISWQLVLAGAAASYIMIKLGLKIWENHGLKRQILCNVQIFLGETGATFHALVDTGHSLREPISQSPVIIAEFEHIKNCLPDGLKVLFYENQENDYAQLLANPGDFYRRIRIIPFSSLGRKNGMLIGFRPDRVAVEGGKETTDVIVGIYNDKLCHDGRYHGLFSPELV